MKHKFLLSALTAIVVFMASTTAEAGVFGRLSVVWNGCSPCEPVACTPCEQIACDPCAVVECDPCANVCGDCGCRPFRPFGGFFANVKARLAAAHYCGPVGCCDAGCGACEPVACTPCEQIACDPCAVVECDPCAADCGYRPFRPFGGFFANLGARLAATPCCTAGCDPCDPVCEPCAACRQ